jgi:hypothetical protein
MTDKPDVPNVASQIYGLLRLLEKEERKLALAGAVAMLGDTSLLGKSKEDTGAEEGAGEHGPKAALWIKQNGITSDQIANAFSDGEFIADLPGTSKANRTENAYVLCGIGQLLKTGEPKFNDNVARELCKTHKCFDLANHSSNVKEARQWFNGSKQAGWTLTHPGLKRGADLVKQIAK